MSGRRADMMSSLRAHWPEYLMEGAELGIFMISACVFTVLLEYPGSPLHREIPSDLVRRFIIGAAMGLTAVGLIYSPWGKRSGAHMNPAFTLTFLWLRKIGAWDAMFYSIAQTAGGVMGVMISSLLLGSALRHQSIQYAVTVPGPRGALAACLGELLISMLLMLAVLVVSNHRSTARYTGVMAGLLIWLYITFEAPLSGMSMNPARTLGSAIPAGQYRGLWIYFMAPLLGMCTASLIYSLWPGRRVHCAKLHHDRGPCLFRCEHHLLHRHDALAEEVEAESLLEMKVS